MSEISAKAFLDNLDKLEAIQTSIMRAAIDPGDHRLEILRLRRQVIEQLALVDRMGQDLLAGTPALENFRQKFYAMRASIAEHQAKWPAVLIGERRGEFQASVAPVRDASVDFMRWSRSTFHARG